MQSVLNKVFNIALNAPVAQWIEHPPPKGRVTRSIRVGGTILVCVVAFSFLTLTLRVALALQNQSPFFLQALHS